MRRLRRAVCRVLICAWMGVGSGVTPILAQTAQTPVVTGFLVIDQERLFADSAFGQRVVDELRSESQALAEENRRIENALIEEERLITEQRPTISPEEFRALADDFDARVTAIRAAQDRKARSLNSRDEEERLRFLNAAVPVLGTIMQELGATALFDRRAVLLSDDRTDITDRAIAAINAALGTGEDTTLETAPAPETLPLDGATPSEIEQE